MSKKIINPYEKITDYYCFGCCSKNEFGLRLEFIEEDEYLTSKWLPEKKFEGWMGVIHGGIQASLLDEIGSWLVFVKIGTAGVTAEITVQYKNPLYYSDKPITLKAKLIDQKFGIAFIHAELFDAEGHICSTAKMKYFIFDEETAKTKYHYPGKEKFYSSC